MRVLVFGADGMLGHQVVRQLRDRFEVVAVTRTAPTAHAAAALEGARVVTGVDVRAHVQWEAVVEQYRPTAIVNAAGIVKQRPNASVAIESIEVNSLFPHQLAQVCRRLDSRLILLSTDCVFSGRRGSYSERDLPDPVDLYGRTKLLGEVTDAPAVTIRTSIIGLELTRQSGLVEWYLHQSGEVPGYTNAIWSGLTTRELARVIESLIVDHQTLSGIWHVASAPISKFDLLRILESLLPAAPHVRPDDHVVIDRSLVGDRFREVTRYAAPTHALMLSELANEIKERRANAIV